MKQEDFDTVTQLGTVAIKTIIIFLALIIAVGVGAYWYSSELNQTTSNTLTNTANTQQEDNNTEADEKNTDVVDTSDEETLNDEWTGTIEEIDLNNRDELIFIVKGEQITVSLGTETLMSTNLDENMVIKGLTIEALSVEDTIRVIGSMDMNTGVIQAQEIILVNGKATRRSD